MTKFFSFLALLVLGWVPIVAAQQIAPGPNPDCGGPAFVPPPTNAGTSFLLCYEENINADTVHSHAEGYLGLYLATLQDTATMVTITCNRYPAMNKVIELEPNVPFTYDISDDTIHESDGTIDTLRDLWITSDERIDNRVVQVQASAPIVCYGLDFKPYSSDAVCALAGENVGTEYSILSYPTSPGGVEGGPASSEFAIAAFQDNTLITIVPSALTIGGETKLSPESFTLQQGQCVQIQADTQSRSNGSIYLDLTGSTILASRPVAVYAGHVESEVPDGWVRLPDQYVDRDMLWEAMPPTSAWGESFALDAIGLDSTGMFGPDGDLMRVLALEDSTVVSIGGVPWTTLGRNQFQDDSLFDPTLVTSNNPLLVGELEHSEYVYGGNGDPFLAIVPPLEQTFNQYTFVLPASDTFRYQSVIIAADTASVGTIAVDGNPIARGKFVPVPGSTNGRNYAICEYPLSQGEHTIATSALASEGFTILGYGVGAAISYGYSAGSLMVPQRALMIQNPPEAMAPNVGDSLTFSNTAYQPAYLDSSKFIPANPADAKYGIHISENIATDIGRMDIGQTSTIHFAHSTPLDHAVSGTVKLYCHLPSYFSIEPEVGTVIILADNAAVSDNVAMPFSVSASPNPFTLSLLLDFSVPAPIDLTITVYDALGRLVRRIEVSPGASSLFIGRENLPAGVYLCQIESNLRNIHVRIPIVAGE